VSDVTAMLARLSSGSRLRTAQCPQAPSVGSTRSTRPPPSSKKSAVAANPAALCEDLGPPHCWSPGGDVWLKRL